MLVLVSFAANAAVEFAHDHAVQAEHNCVQCRLQSEVAVDPGTPDLLGFSALVAAAPRAVPFALDDPNASPPTSRGPPT
ncbi:MAG: hypothetical protein AAF481_12610 [Acidobacteriota bacterium]